MVALYRAFRVMISTMRVLSFLVASVTAIGTATGCSLVIESRDRQCEQDEDCSGFVNATCDVAGGVCVARVTTTSGSTGSAACAGADGCFACPPTTTEEFLNACTDVGCLPFDNTQLQGLLLEDGSVPPVP